jgi:beta-glucanase (GH16 family)
VCTFVDDFAGNKLDSSKWIAQQTYTSGYQNGGECFVNSPNNVSVSNGALNLTARRESSTFQCQYPGGSYETRYTSGMVSTYGRFSQAFGRFEIRAKFPAATVAGLQSALWMWPVDPNKYGAWPGSGEIDIAESYSQYPDRVIPYVHYDSAPADMTVTNNYCMINDVSAFHSYVAEWTPTAITIKYDGQTCMSHALSDGGRPFDQPFIMALTQALGQGSNAVTDSTPFPATTTVDYVRVWK